MEMRKRWDRLVGGFTNLRRLLKQHRHSMATVGFGGNDPELDQQWEACEDWLKCVLLPLEKDFVIGRWLANARRAFKCGETGVAWYELGLAWKRAKYLRRLYGYE